MKDRPNCQVYAPPLGQFPITRNFDDQGSRPLMSFAGIWREWEGDRGTKTVPDVGKHLVFSFLTTDTSPDVAPIHPDATPVILLDEGAREMWMNASWELAQGLQKPPPPSDRRKVSKSRKAPAVRKRIEM